MKRSRLVALLGLTLCILAATLVIQPQTRGQDSAKALLHVDHNLSSLGVTEVRVVDTASLSGVAKVEVIENRGPE